MLRGARTSGAVRAGRRAFPRRSGRSCGRELADLARRLAASRDHHGRRALVRGRAAVARCGVRGRRRPYRDSYGLCAAYRSVRARRGVRAGTAQRAPARDESRSQWHGRNGSGRTEGGGCHHRHSDAVSASAQQRSTFDRLAAFGRWPRSALRADRAGGGRARCPGVAARSGRTGMGGRRGPRARGARRTGRSGRSSGADRVRVHAQPIRRRDQTAAWSTSWSVVGTTLYSLGRSTGAAPIQAPRRASKPTTYWSTDWSRAKERAFSHLRAALVFDLMSVSDRSKPISVMPGAGTDKTRSWIEAPGPIMILVEPQLGENIGAARVMANFGLGRLRLVRLRTGGPIVRHAARPRSRSDPGPHRLVRHPGRRDCRLYRRIGDRARSAKPVIGPDQAAVFLMPHVSAGENVAVLFGRERYGLENAEVALADRIVTFPVNPAFASLNLAQAVAVVAYEWFKHASGSALLSGCPSDRSRLASSRSRRSSPISSVSSISSNISGRSTSERPMLVNLRNIFARMQPTRQDIQTCTAWWWRSPRVARGRRAAVLDGEEAAALRALLAEYADARAPGERGPVRGLARLLRRNPTEAERVLWQALTGDRRLAGMGFKRQTPVGSHIVDFVSFPLRTVIDLRPEAETAGGGESRRSTHLADRARLSRCRRRRAQSKPPCSKWSTAWRRTCDRPRRTRERDSLVSPSVPRLPPRPRRAGSPCRCRPRGTARRVWRGRGRARRYGNTPP